MNEPLVSIGVVTYHSAKTIVETLDSIAAQTYRRIELIVSDDCSSDDTVGVCQKWIASHKDRFVNVQMLTTKENTGTSANCNRAVVAGRGDYYITIAGDDRFLPDGVELLVSYMRQHPDATVLFSRPLYFGGSEADRARIDKAFNYDFFTWSLEQQWHQLIFERNCIPAVGVMFSREKMHTLGLEYDERITLMEDWPMWINLLRKGVCFHYLNASVVEYRVDSGVSTGMLSPRFYETCRRFVLLYLYPEWVKNDPEDALKRMVAHETEVYTNFYNKVDELDRVHRSKAYKLGKFILKMVGR